MKTWIRRGTGVAVLSAGLLVAGATGAQAAPADSVIDQGNEANIDVTQAQKIRTSVFQKGAINVNASPTIMVSPTTIVSQQFSLGNSAYLKFPKGR